MCSYTKNILECKDNAILIAVSAKWLLKIQCFYIIMFQTYKVTYFMWQIFNYYVHSKTVFFSLSMGYDVKH